MQQILKCLPRHRVEEPEALKGNTEIMVEKVEEREMNEEEKKSPTENHYHCIHVFPSMFLIFLSISFIQFWLFFSFLLVFTT